jgi:hypothetical protein
VPIFASKLAGWLAGYNWLATTGWLTATPPTHTTVVVHHPISELVGATALMEHGAGGGGGGLTEMIGQRDLRDQLVDGDVWMGG